MRYPIPETELNETFIRAGGPGGQNVNKVASAVQLRFDVGASPSLPEPVKRRLIKLAGHLVTSDGVIVIEASRHRTQARNRADARARLSALIDKAAKRPRARRPTKPTRASVERRLKAKASRGAVKKMRGTVSGED